MSQNRAAVHPLPRTAYLIMPTSQVPSLGRDRAVEIDVFADELRRDRGPRADQRPAGPDAVHAAEARFIGKHDAQSPSAPSGGPPRLAHSIRKAPFLKAFCAAMSRLG